MNTLALTFQATQFDIVDRNSQPWLRLHQIGAALGYSRPDAVNKIYQSNADEFTDTMTALVELETEGGKQQVRVFSLRGCHLLAMLSRTKIAKEFRKWVLDILDNQSFGNTEQLPEAKTKKALAGGLSLDQQDTIKALVKSRAEDLPKDKQAGAIIKQWSAIKKKFGCTYKEVSPDNFVNIISLITRLPIEGELLPKEPATNSATINLAPLEHGKVRRWLVIQMATEAIMMHQLSSDQKIMSMEEAIIWIIKEGYIVVKEADVVGRLSGV